MSNAEVETERPLLDILPDFPSGPLTEYRLCSSFDWRKMKLFIDGGEDVIRYKHALYSSLEKNSIFSKSNLTPSLDEQRHVATKRLKALKELNIITPEMIENDPKLSGAFTEAIFNYDINVPGKMSVMQMFIEALLNLGSDRHLYLVEKARRYIIQGCFALTEVAHGSNVKGIKTTATYKPDTKQFVLHTENFQAAKCWMGHLGKSATHAIVYAKLIMPDGKNMGLHAFAVPLRDTKTMKTFHGVIIGDLGEKLGINGIDNGFLMFDTYPIPKENLLNKFGDIDDDDVYRSSITSETKRLAVLLQTVAKGRVYIPIASSTQLLKALIIAIRYSAVRKQFSPDDSQDELPVLEYQLQQFRLLPYLAAGLGARIFANWLVTAHGHFLMAKKSGSENTSMSVLLQEMEFHAITSATKPLITWMARDGIQVCREACGGHGYLKISGIGELRNDNDANITYEGENNVLLQQAGNWLIYLWKKMQTGQKIISPIGTASFINDYQNILKSRPKGNAVENIQDILAAYKWLICYTLNITGRKILDLLKDGEGMFHARNHSQAYHGATISMLYAQHIILNIFYEFIQKSEDENIKNVLMKVITLLGAWQLEKHLGTLYMGKYMCKNMGLLLRELVVKLCKELKSEAVTLVDAISPPDFILNSPLGNSDGYIYKHLQNALFSNPGVFTRPTWWMDIPLADEDDIIKSKL